MSPHEVFISFLLAWIFNEIFGLTDWVSKPIMRLAARRWTERTGIDHRESFEEDLEKAPTGTTRLLMSLWYLLGSVVPPEWLTLGLPSIWRLSRPYRQTARLAAHIVLLALRKGVHPRVLTSHLVARRHWWMLAMAAATLSPRTRDRYLEEWIAEVTAIPTRIERTRFCMSIVASSPRLALMSRQTARTR